AGVAQPEPFVEPNGANVAAELQAVPAANPGERVAELEQVVVAALVDATATGNVVAAGEADTRHAILFRNLFDLDAHFIGNTCGRDFPGVEHSRPGVAELEHVE